MKKLMVLVLAAAMVLALVPMTAMAAEVTVNNETELNNAINAASDGDTIKLGASFTAANSITVKKKIILNLNGCTLTSTTNSANGAIYVGLTGDLTINGNGGITANNTYTIGNYGQVTINGGTFEGYYALYNFNYESTGQHGSATINGGTFKSNSAENVSIANCGELIVNDGAVIEDTLDSTAELTVNGGEIEKLALDTPDYVAGAGTSTSVTGGIIGSVVSEANGDSQTPQAGFITGGTFAEAPADELISANAPGTYVDANGNTVVGIAPVAEPEPIPETGDGMGIFVFAGLALISMLGMVAMKKREEF